MATVLAACAIQVVVSSTATAATQCAVNNQSGTTWFQFCEYDNGYSGSHFNGTSGWNYADSKVSPSRGIIAGTLRDNAANGECAQAKIGWEATSAGPITWVPAATACGK